MLWLVVRIVVVLAGLAAGPDVASAWQGGFGSIALLALFLILTAFGCAAVLGLCRFVRLGKKTARLWQRPSWKARMLFGEPLQFVHGVAWYFVSAAVSAAFFTLGATGRDLQGAVVVGGWGAGMLAGVHLFVRLFPQYFAGDSRNAVTVHRPLDAAN